MAKTTKTKKPLPRSSSQRSTKSQKASPSKEHPTGAPNTSKLTGWRNRYSELCRVDIPVPDQLDAATFTAVERVILLQPSLNDRDNITLIIAGITRQHARGGV